MKSTPLKYHGAKSYLAKLIVAIMPPDHVHYVETHFASGAVLFEKPPQLVEGYSEVANDLNGELMNFWECLQDGGTFAEMSRILCVTPFSETAFRKSRKATGGGSKGFKDNVDRAVEFFIACRQSMAGRFASFSPLSRTRTRRGMNEQASAWLSAIDGLPDARERLIRVAILCDDAVRVIKQQDGPQTLFYCDPPYLQSSRVSQKTYGQFEYTDEQHAELLGSLAAVSGRFILSGYPSDLYEEVRKTFGWHRIDIAIDNKASSKKTKDVKTECLWTNFRPAIEELPKELSAIISSSTKGDS